MSTKKDYEKFLVPPQEETGLSDKTMTNILLASVVTISLLGMARGFGSLDLGSTGDDKLKGGKEEQEEGNDIWDNKVSI